MGGLLSRLALHDAANVIRSHVLPWLERREQAAAMITKQYVQTVDSTHPVRKECCAIWANGSVGKNKGGDTTTRTGIESFCK